MDPRWNLRESELVRWNSRDLNLYTRWNSGECSPMRRNPLRFKRYVWFGGRQSLGIVEQLGQKLLGAIVKGRSCIPCNGRSIAQKANPMPLRPMKWLALASSPLTGEPRIFSRFVSDKLNEGKPWNLLMMHGRILTHNNDFTSWDH
jgi:hypothetical protein